MRPSIILAFFLSLGMTASAAVVERGEKAPPVTVTVTAKCPPPPTVTITVKEKQPPVTKKVPPVTVIVTTTTTVKAPCVPQSKKVPVKTKKQ